MFYGDTEQPRTDLPPIDGSLLPNQPSPCPLPPFSATIFTDPVVRSAWSAPGRSSTRSSVPSSASCSRLSPARPSSAERRGLSRGARRTSGDGRGGHSRARHVPPDRDRRGLVFGFLGLGLLGGAPGGGIAVLSIFVVIALLVVLAYTVGLSALGGYLGAYLAREYPDTRRRTRDTIGFSTASEHPSRTADVPPPSNRDADSLSTRDRDPDTMRGWDRDGRSDGEPSDGSDEDRYPDRDRDREPKR